MESFFAYRLDPFEVEAGGGEEPAFPEEKSTATPRGPAAASKRSCLHEFSSSPSSSAAMTSTGYVFPSDASDASLCAASDSVTTHEPAPASTP